MIAPLRRPTLLLALALLLAAIAPAARPAAAATNPPTVYAWDLRASFTSGGPRVIVTKYEATTNPPGIISSSAIDITASCKPIGPGAITYAGGKASFPGNAAIRCGLPVATLAHSDCEAAAANFFSFAFQGRPAQGGRANPLLTSGSGSFAFAAPSVGASAQTAVQVNATSYLTPPWPIGASNQALTALDGDMAVTASDVLGLYSWVQAGWKPIFLPLPDTQVGELVNAAGGTQTWTTPAMTMLYREPPSTVDIGYSAATGAYYQGDLSYVEGDPPGCTGK